MAGQGEVDVHGMIMGASPMLPAVQSVHTGAGIATLKEWLKKVQQINQTSQVAKDKNALLYKNDIELHGK